VRVFVVYRPVAFFFWPCIAAIGTGTLIGIRFLYFLITSDGDGHIQSLILASMCLILGTVTLLIAFLAEMIAANRKLLERLALRLQRVEHSTRQRSFGPQ
jgi:hypothetical protein